MNYNLGNLNIIQAKKFFSIGIEQKSEFYYCEMDNNLGFTMVFNNQQIANDRNREKYSAFTTTELLNFLPNIIKKNGIKYGLTIEKSNETAVNFLWQLGYKNKSEILCLSVHNSILIAIYDFYLYLIDNNLIHVNDINLQINRFSKES